MSAILNTKVFFVGTTMAIITEAAFLLGDLILAEDDLDNYCTLEAAAWHGRSLFKNGNVLATQR